MLCVPFCHPFGAYYVIAFTRGFTPGYILSALRACRKAVVGAYCNTPLRANVKNAAKCLI